MTKDGKYKCGILMPISKIETHSEYSKQHWEHVKLMISDSINKTNLFEAVPVWEENSSDQIKKTIFKNIVSVDMAVCDISALNPNVLFELGLRLAIKKPVVIICDNITTPPFDINDIRYVDPKYPVGLNMYEIPQYQENLCKTIISTWNRYKEEGTDFSQLEQLRLPKKKTIVNDNGEILKDSEVFVEILDKIRDISKDMFETKSNKFLNNGTEFLQVQEDIKSFQETINNFLEKIKKDITEDDLNDFQLNVQVHFRDIKNFMNRIEDCIEK